MIDHRDTISRRGHGFLVGAALLAALTTTAVADVGPKFERGLFLPVGLSLGGAFRGDGVPNSFLLGVETSLAFFEVSGPPSGVWAGVVTDVAYDFERAAVRYRAGLEAGWWMMGGEITYIGAFDDGHQSGIGGRLTATLQGIVSVYGGYGRFFSADAGFGELGLLIKVPLPLWTQYPARRATDRVSGDQPE